MPETLTDEQRARLPECAWQRCPACGPEGSLRGFPEGCGLCGGTGRVLVSHALAAAYAELAAKRDRLKNALGLAGAALEPDRATGRWQDDDIEAARAEIDAALRGEEAADA